jgi:hypothetical protein
MAEFTGARFVPGQRVVLRFRLPAGGLKQLSDVIGIVLTDDGQDVRVVPDAAGYKSDDPVTIAWSDVIVAKTVPPRQAPR